MNAILVVRSCFHELYGMFMRMWRYIGLFWNEWYV